MRRMRFVRVRLILGFCRFCAAITHNGSPSRYSGAAELRSGGSPAQVSAFPLAQTPSPHPPGRPLRRVLDGAAICERPAAQFSGVSKSSFSSPRRPWLACYSFFASSTNRSAFVSPKCRHRTVPEESSRNSAIPEMSRLSSPPLGTSRS